MNQPSPLQFADLQRYVTDTLGTEGWLTVYAYIKKEVESTAYFSALVPPEAVDDCLNNTSWDLLIGQGLPGFVQHSNDDTRYLRFGDDDGVEPFIIVRDFHGLKPSYLELSEEFRHFHNLYEDKKTGAFIALDDNGDDVEVVRMTTEKVQVRAKFLRDYLAARGMYLFMYFEYERWSAQTLEDLGLEQFSEEHREATYRYTQYIDRWPSISDGERKTFARMIGKKLVKGTEGYRPESLWDRNERRYEEFIIGTDENGNEVSFTSDEEQLSNYFGKNPGAPHYLTPVFFRKSVMAKYYGEPARYEVQDGHVFCGSYWGLRLDNNHANYVTVFLGDLGKLSHKEQLYWKSFNVVPDGSISDVAFRRGFLGQWTDAAEPSLVFKATYTRFRDRWNAKFGWDLFKPLSEEDEHYWGMIHVPAGENQREFDEQVMALAKLLIERINEKELARHITVQANDKGITKFAKYLDHIGFPKRDQLITLLRNLNGLRSGPAHVKGKDYQRAAEHFDLENKGVVGVFSEILTEAASLLADLDDAVVNEPAQTASDGSAEAQE